MNQRTPNQYPEIDRLIADAQKALQSNLDEVWRLSQELEGLATERNYAYGVGKARLLQGRVLQGRGEVETAFHCLNEVLKFSRTNEDLWLEGEILSVLGVVYQQCSNYDDSFECKLRTVALCRQTGDTDTLVRTLNNLGNDYGHLGDYERCQEFYLEALEISRNTGNTFGEAFSLNNLAGYYGIHQDPENLLLYARQALALAKEFGHRLLEAEVHRCLAEHYREHGAYALAETHGNEAYTIARSLGNPMVASRAILVLGDILWRQNAPEEAVAVFQCALEEAQRHQFSRGVLRALWHMSQAHQKLRQFDESRGCLNRALEILESQQFPEEAMSVYEGLSDLAVAEGDFATALEYYKRFQAIKEEYHGKAAHRRLAAVSTKLKVEHMEREAQAERLRNAELAMAQAELHLAYTEKSALLEKLQAQQTELERMAIQDALTGLHNRRYFEQQMNAAFAESREQKRRLTIAIVDIDNFKMINDRHGHPMGDVVLRRVAATLRDGLRSDDFVARYGGEEFSLLLRNMTPAETDALLQRLVRQIAALTWPEIAPDFRVTISVGYCHDRTLPNAERMMAQADAALYRAKASGKNRVLGDFARAA